MATAPAVELNRYVSISSHRGKSYVAIKSGAIQRWAAKVSKNGEYYTLTGVLWRRSGLVGTPEGSDPTGAGMTIYFKSEKCAEHAASDFVESLQRSGVL